MPASERVPDVAAGWVTDLAVLRETGSTIEDRGDHLVVRTPQNPTFHWGNWLLVTDSAAVDDASRWIETFAAAFPSANWLAIGLARMPDAVTAWTDRGIELGVDDVLGTRVLPRQTRLAPGYTVRRLTADADWEQLVARDLAENARTAEFPRVTHEDFVRARVRAHRQLSERDAAAFFGAFVSGPGGAGQGGESLAADLGIVRCGHLARYQNVGTDAEHRRRGLASHLLGVAARWAAGHGCEEWVIVTEEDNPAGRVYRSVGFALDHGNVQAYRPPER